MFPIGVDTESLYQYDCDMVYVVLGKYLLKGNL